MADAIKKSVKNKSDMQVIKRKNRHECVACKETFQYECLLKYHIRRHHFNRICVVPYAETQNVNQVWFEKVGKTGIIVKMQKLSENALLMQKLKDSTTIQPTEIEPEVIDLRKYYPICSDGHSRRQKMLKCRVCQKNCGQRQLSKHFKECHAELIKDKCDTCGSPFKKLIHCAKHICPQSGILEPCNSELRETLNETDDEDGEESEKENE